MRLTIVGCSGSVPGPESSCSCYLVEQDGFRLLLDLGTGATGPLLRYAEPDEIDAVVVSHAHGDHWAGLVDLGYLRVRSASRRPLPVTGPSDLPPVLRTNPDVFAITTATAGRRQVGPWSMRLAAVEHHRECWATRLDDTLCFTGDTAPCAAIDDLAAGCRVLLAEASGLDTGDPQDGHLTAGDAGRLAARSGAELLILTHLRPWLDPVALQDEAAAAAGCPVVLAYPGLRVRV